MRARRLVAEESADNESRLFEEREAENLRQESELFLARQMDEMQALQDEQRKAGMLLDDGAPVRLNVSMVPIPTAKTDVATKEKTLVFGAEEEEEEGVRKRKAPLVKLDLAEGGEKAKERLEKIAASVPKEKEALFKGKVRWDGLSDVSACVFVGDIRVDQEPGHDRQETGTIDQTPDDQVSWRVG
jgi:RNA-binding protein 25